MYSTATSATNGTATFTDLGIAGTGVHTVSFSTGSVIATSRSITVNPLPPQATVGKWDNPVGWDIVPLHIHLLPTEKSWPGASSRPMGAWGCLAVLPGPVGWGARDSADGTRGHDVVLCRPRLMADGRLMVSGGHKADNRGIDVTNIFDPVTESSRCPDFPRWQGEGWYPHRDHFSRWPPDHCCRPGHCSSSGSGPRDLGRRPMGSA